MKNGRAFCVCLYWTDRRGFFAKALFFSRKTLYNIHKRDGLRGAAKRICLRPFSRRRSVPYNRPYPVPPGRARQRGIKALMREISMEK